MIFPFLGQPLGPFDQRQSLKYYIKDDEQRKASLKRRTRESYRPNNTFNKNSKGIGDNKKEKHLKY